MSMEPQILAILAQGAFADARPHFTPETTLEEQLKLCFQSALKPDVHWLVRGTDDECFRIGVAALLLHHKGGTVEHERIQRSYKPLLALSAAMNGIPVDWEQTSLMAGDDTIPLLGLYHEVKEGK